MVHGKMKWISRAPKILKRETVEINFSGQNIFLLGKKSHHLQGSPNMGVQCFLSLIYFTKIKDGTGMIKRTKNRSAKIQSNVDFFQRIYTNHNLCITNNESYIGCVDH